MVSLLAYADSRACGEGLHRGKRVVLEVRWRIVKPSLREIAVRFMKICSRMVSGPLMDSNRGLEFCQPLNDDDSLFELIIELTFTGMTWPSMTSCLSTVRLGKRAGTRG